jgi:hypothetical protein
LEGHFASISAVIAFSKPVQVSILLHFVGENAEQNLRQIIESADITAA